jgi:hypothetical protein
MASRIKARECRDHALVVSARTPSLSVSMKLGMNRRAEYYIVVTSMTGERNISLKPHKQQDGKILTSDIYQQNLTPS